MVAANLLSLFNNKLFENRSFIEL